MASESKSNQSSIAFWIAGIIFFLAIVCGIFFLTNKDERYYRRHAVPFDQNKWLAGTPEQRGFMVVDLLGMDTKTFFSRRFEPLDIDKIPKLKGKNRKELIIFLGKPDEDRDTKLSIFYRIGYMDNRKSFGHVEDGLFFTFDDEGNVESFHVTR